MSYFHNKEGRNILIFLVHFTLFIPSSEASITLTVSPSGPVEVNQTVTLQCTFESFPGGAVFYIRGNPSTSFCDLTANISAKVCKGACASKYTTSCPNDKVYSVVYPVPRSWNGKGVYCTNILGQESNQVNFSVIVLVTSVTLTPAQITVDAGKQITLTCQSDYCNPAVNITWYKASTMLATPITDTIDTNSNGLIRSTSVLQYTGVAGDNGQQVYCRATNRPGKNVESNKNTLDVRYPPSTDPVGTASPPGHQYNTGTTVTLTCQISGGNPVATLSWRCKNTVMTGTNQSNSTTAVSVLTLMMDNSYNNQQCTCTANHSLLNRPKSRSVSLTVLYPPSTDPLITASPEGLQYNTGTTVTLTCQISGGNPVATLSWRCKNTVMTGTNQSNSTTAVSVLSLVMDNSYNNQQCTCTATHNLLINSKSTSVSLTVFYPPSTDPLITASPPGLQYNNGTRVTLTCQLPGGNPVATLSWRCKNTVMTGTNQSNSTTAVSVLLLVMDSSYNNQQCTCTATHRLLTSPKSTSVLLIVFFSVTSATLTPAQITVDAGKQISLTCQTDYCYPAANITWYKASVMLATPTTDTIDTNSNGLIRTTSVLQYTVVAGDNGQRVYCRAMNKKGQSVESRWLTLNIRSISEVVILPSRVLNLVVGQRYIIINCFVEYAYPEENIGYRWIRSDGFNSSFVASSQTYVIKTVSFEDSGRYICTASNSVGNSSGIIDVSVQFTPLAPRIEYIVCKSTFATITWTTPYTAYNDVKLQETLQYSKLNKNFVNVTNEQLNSTDTNTHNQKVTMLKPGTEYTFRVLTSNRYGVTFSNTMSCVTDPERLKENYQGCDNGQIIGGTLGGFALFFILAMCFFILYKHRQRKGKSVETNQNARYVDQFSKHDVHQYEGISTDTNKGTLNSNFYEKIEASNPLDKRDEYMELPDSSYKNIDKSTEVSCGLYSNTK